MIERFRAERLELIAISGGVMIGALTYLALAQWLGELERAHRRSEVGEE